MMTKEQTIAVEEESLWKTNDLLLATVLRCHGHIPTHIEYDSDARSCYWMFERRTELLAVVAQFSLERCRVEPKEFNSYYVGLKDEMFEFMRDEGVHPRGARGRR